MKIYGFSLYTKGRTKMIKNDYILRMIEQMGDVLRKVFALENKSDFKTAHNEIDTAMKQLGASELLAMSLPASELIRIVQRPGDSESDRCLLLSQLIGADAHIYRTEGQFNTAHDLYTTALEILMEISKDAEGEKLEQINKDIDGLRLCIRENIANNKENLDI
jgi:hypothetical protein